MASNSKKGRTYDLDVCVVGAGHNGLVAAALLAQQGLDVAIYERNARVGGLAGSLDIDGVSVPLAATDFGLFRADLARRLSLQDYGWDEAARGSEDSELIGSIVVGEGRSKPEGVRLFSDRKRLIDSVARLSSRDAEKLPSFLDVIERCGTAFEKVLRAAPSIGITAALARQPELIRFVSASLQDLLGWWFESPAVKVALAGLALQHSALGPRAQGTGWLLLYHLAGSTSDCLRPAVTEKPGEAGAFVNALAASARGAGAVIHTRLGVDAIRQRKGRLRDVRLEDGSSLTAKVVISTLDAPATLLGLVGAQHLPVRAVRLLRRLRMEGHTARWTQSNLGDFRNRTVVTSGLDGMQKAQDWAKRGKPSVNPWLLVDSQAVNCHYLPYSACADGDAVAAFQRATEDLLRRAVKSSEDSPSATSLWCTPRDWETRVGATQGSETQGWMTLDQSLVLRPISGWSGSTTPIENLFLGGAAAHPGGGITGLPGLAAAERTLAIVQDRPAK